MTIFVALGRSFIRSRELTQRYGIHVVASEMASTVPYTRIALNFGVMLGVLAGLDQFLVEVLPKQVKRAVTGNTSATKAEIIR